MQEKPNVALLGTQLMKISFRELIDAAVAQHLYFRLNLDGLT